MDRRTASIQNSQPVQTLRFVFVLCPLLCALLAGCYAPLHSPGIAAHTLPDDFRWPTRTSAAPLNYSHLVGQAPLIYRLGTGDTLRITAPDLIAQGHSEPFEVQVLDQGEIYLPRLGPVVVGGLSVAQTQQRVNQALSNGLLTNPNTVVALTEKGTVNVLVLGAVENPGVHALPRYENDVAHALAAAQGFAEDAGDVIEIHRRGQCITPMLHSVIQPNFPVHQLDRGLGRQSSPTAEVIGHSMASLSPSHGSPPPLPARNQQSQSRRTFGNMPVGAITATQTAIRSSRYSLSGVPDANRFKSSFSNTDGTTPYRSVKAPAAAPQGGHEPVPVNNSDSGRVVFRGQSPMHGVNCGEFECGQQILRIPLRGGSNSISPTDVMLNPGDVLVIPRKTDKVFYVVGPLSEQNSIRFSVNDRDREIGGGLLLPDDREIDVVTAVAMAGYIDPIESPTTVTVHRIMPDRKPLLIRVDLIAARSNPQETVMIRAGDIVYLNPDAWWYGRRTFDRVVERALGTAVGRWLTN